jgi:very-short-patch-repair endonuclease
VCSSDLQHGSVPPQDAQDDASAADDFVDSVATFIEGAGYTVRRSVGCSNYKIDIAIEHPDKPDRFLAGIECDGHAYVNTKTARDRDHLRREVLEKMGWTMYRVWSPEWINNPDTEQKNLKQFINATKLYGKQLPETKAAQSRYDVAETVQQYTESASSDVSSTAPVVIEDTVELLEHEPVTIPNANKDNPYGFEYYKEALWSESPGLYGNTNVDRIKSMIRHIVEVEQPIHIDLLYIRMAPAFGNQRITRPIRQSVDTVLGEMEELQQDKYNFFITKGFNSHRVRIARPGDPPRPVNFIAPIELSLALLAVAKNSIGTDKIGLIEATSQALGYSRKDARIVDCIHEAFSRLLALGKISLVDGKVNVIRGV